MLSRCFNLGVFEFFVSSLFLLPIEQTKPYCVSVTYKGLAGFQEEDHDIKFTGNYTMRGWLLQPPPHRMYLCRLVE